MENCYLNGRFVPITEAFISIADLGFIHGVTVTEQLRTIGGTPFLLNEHLDRFATGLDLLGLQLPQQSDLPTIVRTVVAKQTRPSDPKDCAVGILCTPGTTNRFGHVSTGEPTLCVYSYGLPTHYNDWYRYGVNLKLSSVQDVNPQSWPKNVKIRSRLHYYLADLQADAGSFALLCDENGHLRDTSISTPFYVFADKELTISPRSGNFNSVSLGYLLKLARDLGFQIREREVHRSEIGDLKAVGLVNSLFCLCSAQCINEQPLATELAEIRALRERWHEETGLKFQ